MKYIESRKHSIEAFQTNFKQVITAKEVEDLLTWYLVTVKANPAFINCSFLLSARKLSDLKLKAFQKVAHKTFRKLGFNKYSDFTRWRATQYDIYRPDGTAIENIPEGVIEAVMLGNYGLLYESLHKDPVDKEDIYYFIDLMKSFVSHPSLNLRSLDTAIGLIGSAQNSLESIGEELDLFKVMLEWTYTAANRILLNTDPKQLAKDFADIWLNEGSVAVRWVIYDLFLNQPLQKLATASKPIITPIFEELYNIADGGSTRLNENAKQWLRFFLANPSGKIDEDSTDVACVIMGLARTIEALKNELPNPVTYQLLIRFMQDADWNNRWQIISQLGSTVIEGDIRIDDRAQQLFESVLGMDTWKLLCLVQDERFWTDTETDPETNFVSRLGMRSDLREVQQYTDGVKQVEWHRHASKTCMALEKLVHSTGVTPLEIESLKAERLYLLSEEVIRTVTHSYTHPTVLRRRKNEFLGAELPKVTLSEISGGHVYGAACMFKIFLPNEDIPLSGEMDEEGSVLFDNVLALTPLTLQALEAVVIDSLCQILIPQLVEGLPSTGKKGFRIPATTEIYAVRPTIHTMGDLENRSNDDEQSAGTRINPEIATKLFQWLLGERTDCQFRLYQLLTVKQKGRKETFFCTDYDAHELILSRDLALSNVYMRTIRAHTKPVGVGYNDRGDIVVQQMSARAERNYGRYLKDIGRKLDLSVVRKTYTLPNGRKMVLDIPRTFNQGAFCTLEEAWKYILDLNVKAQAYQMFKF